MMELTQEVVGVLDRAEITGSHLVLTGTLDRKLYMQVNKALEALGGKWDRRAKAHVFCCDPAETIESAILTGSAIDQKKELDFFPTPAPVAAMLIRLGEIVPAHKVLEPSAGEGAILEAMPTREMNVCEIDEDRSAKLRLMGASVVGVDFLEYRPGPIYDRIVANPPFSKRRDLAHVGHMWDCLKAGGRLVSVMSAGFGFRGDRATKELREKIGSHRIIGLPEKSFAKSGTNVNAIVIVADKPH